MIDQEEKIKEKNIVLSVLRQMREEIDNLSQALSSLRSTVNETLSLKTHIDKQNPLFLKNHLDAQGVIQTNLLSSWLIAKHNNLPVQNLNQIGFRVFSQNNEDGLLLYIFTLIGVTNKLFVEIGANTDDSDIGLPENNTTNLVVYHGWNGLIVDADPTFVNQLIYFFAKCKNTKHYHWQDRKSKQEDESNYINPMIKAKFITAENINSYLLENKIPAEIDLLSIDIDGMDYHVWKALEVSSPRVVLIEFNQRINFSETYIPPKVLDTEKNRPYSPGEQSIFNGCSLNALIRLGKEKNYRLIAVTSSGFNALFMRNDVGAELFKELTEEEVQNLPLWHWTENKDFKSAGSALEEEGILSHG